MSHYETDGQIPPSEFMARSETQSWHRHSFRVPDQTPSSLSRRHQRRYHRSKRDYIMVVDSVMEWRCISWWQTLSWNGGVGETLERRCQERLLRWSRKSSIMAADSIMEWTAVTITAARKTPYVICQQERLSHQGTEDSMSIMAVRETPSRWLKGLDMHRSSIRDSICR